MKKKSSKKIGKTKKSLIVDSSFDSKKSREGKEEIINKLMELSDDELERLFEAGKISQNEYEYILGLKKKAKEKNKSQQQKFEERIRCNNIIIDKIIKLGRKFRREELQAQQNREEARLQALLAATGSEQEQDVERGERIKSKEDRARQKQREALERNSRGRGRERDR